MQIHSAATKRVMPTKMPIKSGKMRKNPLYQQASVVEVTGSEHELLFP
jgi:hypothetical protein